MLKKTVLALATVVAVALPTAAFGQVGIAVRAGTLGVGGEAAIGLGKMLQVRGGYGSTMNYTYNGTFSDKSYTVAPPSGIWNVGVDLFPFGGGFHISAGLLNRKQFDLTGDYSGSNEIGGHTYNGQIHLVGAMKNEKETGPYAAIGFGHTSSKGLGIGLDLGMAQLGDGAITFDANQSTCTANGQNCNDAQFKSDVQAEANKANNDIGTFLKWHPILSLSLHYGL